MRSALNRFALVSICVLGICSSSEASLYVAYDVDGFKVHHLSIESATATLHLSCARLDALAYIEVTDGLLPDRIDARSGIAYVSFSHQFDERSGDESRPWEVRPNYQRAELTKGIREFSEAASSARRIVLRHASPGETYAFEVDEEAKEGLVEMLRECPSWKSWRDFPGSSRGPWTS